MARCDRPVDRCWHCGFPCRSLAPCHNLALLEPCPPVAPAMTPRTVHPDCVQPRSASGDKCDVYLEKKGRTGSTLAPFIGFLFSSWPDFAQRILFRAAFRWPGRGRPVRLADNPLGGPPKPAT